MTNIYTASNQYNNRPADERFTSLQELIDEAQHERDFSAERAYSLRDLEAFDDNDTVKLGSPNGAASLTHWSFGQLSRVIGAPAGYLRSLPAHLAARNINHGLHASRDGSSLNLLVKGKNGGDPVVRAATSETYGRVWDSVLYSALADHFGDGKRSKNGGEWQAPPVWPGSQPGGQYRGDRDSFVIRVDGGSIVSDPRGWSAIGNNGGRLHRGILVRNSETGACAITIECVLFDVICGNHILWGAVVDRTFRRRHVGQFITRAVIIELQNLAYQFNQRSAESDERIIRALVSHEIAFSREAVVSELRKLGATKEQATAAYDTAEAKEPGLNPRSWWGIAAGLTRYSQESGHQDDRLALDQLAASILRTGAKQLVVA